MGTEFEDMHAASLAVTIHTKLALSKNVQMNPQKKYRA